jgi:hypothetical protein
MAISSFPQGWHASMDVVCPMRAPVCVQYLDLNTLEKDVVIEAHVEESSCDEGDA